jgi:hypothetical protein
LDDPQKYIGRNVAEVSKELGEQGEFCVKLTQFSTSILFLSYYFAISVGYTVHLVRVGHHATGLVPLARPGEKRIVLSYDANNGDQVIGIREGVNDGERMSDHANMQWRP